jgi:hypothetical protein
MPAILLRHPFLLLGLLTLLLWGSWVLPIDGAPPPNSTYAVFVGVLILPFYIAWFIAHLALAALFDGGRLAGLGHAIAIVLACALGFIPYLLADVALAACRRGSAPTSIRR